VTLSGANEWFLGDSGSMEGSMIQTSADDNSGGTNAAREKTMAWHSARCGNRKAAPDDPCAPTDQMAGETGGLGIVEDHDVAWLDPPDQNGSIRFEDRSVVGTLVSTELSGISRDSMKPVVQSFGDGKELGVGIDDDPAGVDPGVVHIAHEKVQHLGHAPAGGRRADVPEPPTNQGATGALGGFS